MAKEQTSTAITALVLDDAPLTLLDICHAVGTSAETVVELVEYGVIEPQKGQAPATWQFSAYTLKRTRVATRLQQDLAVNLAGLGLAMDLLEEVHELRRRIRFYEQHVDDRG